MLLFPNYDAGRTWHHAGREGMKSVVQPLPQREAENNDERIQAMQSSFRWSPANIQYSILK